MIDPNAQMLAALAQQSAGPDPMQGLFGAPPAALQRLAGDVVPLPIQPGPNAGPTPLSTPHAWTGGNRFQFGSPPNVLPIGDEKMREWLDRMRLRQSGK